MNTTSQDQPAVVTERAEKHSALHYRWNFRMLILDAASYWTGVAFFDPNVVLPTLLGALGGGPAIVGLLRFLQTFGYTVPSLLASHAIHGQARHKRFLLWCCGLGRVGLLTLPPVILLFAAHRPGLVIGWLVAVCTVFWLMDGGSAVSWYDIVGKAIPARKRGRFYGTMQMVGGLMATVAAMVAAWILAHRGWALPQKFALLAGCWGLGALVSQIALSLIREPDGVVDGAEERPPFGAFLLRMGPLLRNNARLRQLILSRMFVDGAGMAAPFYVLYAGHDLHMGRAQLGLFLFAQSAGKVATGQVWGNLSDRFGPGLGFRCISATVLAVPVLALLAAHGVPWLMFAVFFLLGAVGDGVWMVFSTALMDSVSEQERGFAVGVASMVLAPCTAYALAGGFIAAHAPYPLLFTVAAVFALAGTVLAARLTARAGERRQERGEAGA